MIGFVSWSLLNWNGKFTEMLDMLTDVQDVRDGSVICNNYIAQQIPVCVIEWDP